jgi:hypothetical protein
MPSRIYETAAKFTVSARLTPKQMGKFLSAAERVGILPSVLARRVLLSWAEVIVEKEHGEIAKE